MDPITITHDAINLQGIRTRLPVHSCCGALVQFEGVVRDHNEGREVLGIHYECFEAMTKKELNKIINEAKEKWPIHEAFIVHRIGKLSINEVSLLLLVMSPHRGGAFSASQYIIDQLKQRVPIWKKEFYADGNTEWTQCPH